MTSIQRTASVVVIVTVTSVVTPPVLAAEDVRSEPKRRSKVPQRRERWTLVVSLSNSAMPSRWWQLNSHAARSQSDNCSLRS